LDAPRETFHFRPNVTGRLSVCLVYPNAYAVGMANLGYQAVFRMLATLPEVRCERAFLETGVTGRARVRTLENGRSPADFDILAFSLSFEADYPNVVRVLDRAGIPARASDRRASARGWPLLLGGGPATFLNPEPIAPFFDLFLIGEAEEMLAEAFTAALASTDASHAGLLASLASVEGAYRPEAYDPVYASDGELAGLRVAPDAPFPVLRRYVENLDRRPVTTAVSAPDAVFGEYFLVEASRGCEWGCRFCAAGYMYRPVRHRSAEGVTRDSLAGLAFNDTIGLVGAEMASHPGIATTCERVAAAGGRVSPSSLKADMISARLAKALAAGGTRSVTIAPEAGSERMRRVIDKNLTEGEILRAADLVAGDGVDSLKLYFMCALPTESADDLEGIVELTARIRERMMGQGRSRGRVGRIKVSINPFVPKPWTPFQWDGMVAVADAQKRIGFLRRRLSRMPNVEMESESAREAYLQTLLSRGDRRVSTLVEALARDERGWWSVLQEARRRPELCGGADPDRFVHGEYAGDAVFAWDFIDHRIHKSYLWLERRRAFAERETEPCDVATCHTCGAC
jgi:radical SAM superfamily enzyme YgiQ (UPF0313 family)